MVNYNPETVSTDYDVCDRLYFEEISFEVSDITISAGKTAVLFIFSYCKRVNQIVETRVGRYKIISINYIYKMGNLNYILYL